MKSEARAAAMFRPMRSGVITALVNNVGHEKEHPLERDFPSPSKAMNSVLHQLRLNQSPTQAQAVPSLSR